MTCIPLFGVYLFDPYLLPSSTPFVHRLIQNLVANDMNAGAGAKKIEADEKAAEATYQRLDASYSAWQQRHDTYGTE